MIKYRFFKISINFLFFSVYTNSKVHTIKNNFTLVYLSIWYTLLALCLGWWSTGFSKPFKAITNTIIAIHTNLTGGEDFTEEMEDTEYHDKTNYIWNNLLRETTIIINKPVLALIIEIHEDFEQTNTELFTQSNINYINSNLKKIEMNTISNVHIKDIFDAINLYSINND